MNREAAGYGIPGVFFAARPYFVERTLVSTTLALVSSVACQALAAVLAIRLIWFTGKRWAWGLIAAAILLMVA